MMIQNIAIIISTKCVTDLKCPFNTDSLGRKDLFNLLSSARSYDVNRLSALFQLLLLFKNILDMQLFFFFFFFFFFKERYPAKHTVHTYIHEHP